MPTLIPLLLAALVAEPCSPGRIELVSGQVVSPEPQTQEAGWRTIRQCDPALWVPEVCVVVERRRGTPELRLRLIGEFFLLLYERHPCEQRALLTALRDQDPTLCLNAARILLFQYPQRAPNVVEPLAEQLRDLDPLEDASLAAGILDVLAKVGRPARGAEGAIIPSLESPRSQVRLLACRALSATGSHSSATTQALARLLLAEEYYDTVECAQNVIAGAQHHLER